MEIESNKVIMQDLKLDLQKRLNEKLAREAEEKPFLDDSNMNTNQPFLLISRQNKENIKQYKKGKKIGRVPLDNRLYGKTVFDNHIRNNIRVVNPDPDYVHNIRTPLLCNHGISGSGKTVQQALNMHWFTDRFKNGVVIEITFNDDASDLKIYKDKIRDTDQFEASVAQQIVLRLIEFCYGTNYSIDQTDDVMEYLAWNFERMLKALYPVGIALKKALMFVREVLGLSDDVPILLAVDEIVLLQKDKKDPSDIVEYLKRICKQMDNSFKEDINKQRDRTFWLSVSAYGCFPLVDFATKSSRPLDLQPLPPIFPVTPENMKYKFDILPPLIQCFKKENRFILRVSTV